MSLEPLDDDCARHAARHFAVRFSVRVGMVPVESRFLLGRNLHAIMNDLAHVGEGHDRVVRRGLGRHRQAVEMNVHGVDLILSERKSVPEREIDRIAGRHANRRRHADRAGIAELRRPRRRIDQGIEPQRRDAVRCADFRYRRKDVGNVALRKRGARTMRRTSRGKREQKNERKADGCEANHIDG